MGVRFDSEYVYIYDQDNVPHFLMNHYGANYGDSYRSDIYLPTKSYCVLDLFLTDEVETEGEFLPRVREGEWREFLTAGPSADVTTILAEAGLGDVSVSKLVFVHMHSSSGMILEFDGFVSSAGGVKDFEPDFLQQAMSFAGTKTGSIAEQEAIIADWIAEQVRSCGS